MSLYRFSLSLACAMILTSTAFAVENVAPVKSTEVISSQERIVNNTTLEAKQKLVQKMQAKQKERTSMKASPITKDTVKVENNGNLSAVPAKTGVIKADNRENATKPVAARITGNKIQNSNKPKPWQKSKVVTATVQKPKSLLQVRQVPIDVEQVENNSKKNSKAKHKSKMIAYEERTFYGEVMLPKDYKQLTILGKNEATMAQAVAYIRRYNPKVTLSCPLERLIDYYWQEAAKEGIRADIALCQAITETGFFRYGGDVTHNQNNFCGLGTTGGGVKGARFKTAQIGVRAHIQHLLAYCRKARPTTKVVDPRYDLAHNVRVSRGLIDKWSGLNGTWAMGANYCEKIMSHYVRMLEIKNNTNAAPSKFKKNGERKTMRERIAQY